MSNKPIKEINLRTAKLPELRDFATDAGIEPIGDRRYADSYRKALKAEARANRIKVDAKASRVASSRQLRKGSKRLPGYGGQSDRVKDLGLLFGHWDRPAQIRCWRNMVEDSPVLITAISTTAQLVQRFIGVYQNPDYPKVEEQINATFASLSSNDPFNPQRVPAFGDPLTVQELAAQAYVRSTIDGFYFAELGFDRDNATGDAQLSVVRPWDGCGAHFGYDDSKCIATATNLSARLELRPGFYFHLAGLEHFCQGRPEGLSRVSAASDYRELERSTNQGLGQAVKTAAVPPLIIYGDSSNEFDAPEDSIEPTVSAAEEVTAQVLGLYSNGVCFLHKAKYYDEEDRLIEEGFDLKPLEQRVDYSGILETNRHSLQMQAMAINGFPLGLAMNLASGGLNSGQLEFQRKQYLENVLSVAKGIADRIVHHIVKPQAAYNNGTLDNYGYFQIPTLREAAGDENIAQLVSSLSQAAVQTSNPELQDKLEGELARVIE